MDFQRYYELGFFFNSLNQGSWWLTIILLDDPVNSSANVAAKGQLLNTMFTMCGLTTLIQVSIVLVI